MLETFKIINKSPLGHYLWVNDGYDRSHPHFYYADNAQGHACCILSATGNYSENQEVTLDVKQLNPKYFLDNSLGKQHTVVVGARKALRGDFKNADIVALMAEGNSKAAEIVTDLLTDPFLHDYLTVLTLDDMNIRGEQLKLAYEFCDNSLPALIRASKGADERMVDFINSHYKEETAVRIGASSLRSPGLG